MRILIPVLCILAVLAALAIFLAFRWIRLRVVYDDKDGLRVWLQVLFYKYHIMPQKQEKIKLRDYKIKRFRKLEKKRAKEAEKERRKEKKRKASQPVTEDIAPKLPLPERIAVIASLIGRIIRRFARYLHIDVSKLYIKVATDDAAKTAYLYSAVSQSVAYLTELLLNVTNFDVNKNAEFVVYPDFSTEESELAVDFTFRVRVIDLPKLGDIGVNIFTLGEKPEV